VVWEVSRDGSSSWEAVDASWTVSTEGLSSTLTLTAGLEHDGLLFRAIAEDAAGQTAVSGSALLTVNPAVIPGPDPDPDPDPNPDPDPKPDPGSDPNPKPTVPGKPVGGGLVESGSQFPLGGLLGVLALALGAVVLSVRRVRRSE
ncbi:MAG: hypothetical protein KA158_09435, partial [Leucobacter sp.]|nr:hypothetical protein [Leucobacter sp.]